jgi:hypothetical protein
MTKHATLGTYLASRPNTSYAVTDGDYNAVFRSEFSGTPSLKVLLSTEGADKTMVTMRMTTSEFDFDFEDSLSLLALANMWNLRKPEKVCLVDAADDPSSVHLVIEGSIDISLGFRPEELEHLVESAAAFFSMVLDQCEDDEIDPSDDLGEIDLREVTVES